MLNGMLSKSTANGNGIPAEDNQPVENSSPVNLRYEPASKPYYNDDGSEEQDQLLRDHDVSPSGSKPYKEQPPLSTNYRHPENNHISDQQDQEPHAYIAQSPDDDYSDRDEAYHNGDNEYDNYRDHHRRGTIPSSNNDSEEDYVDPEKTPSHLTNQEALDQISRQDESSPSRQRSNYDRITRYHQHIRPKENYHEYSCDTPVDADYDSRESETPSEQNLAHFRRKATQVAYDDDRNKEDDESESQNDNDEYKYPRNASNEDQTDGSDQSVRNTDTPTLHRKTPHRSNSPQRDITSDGEDDKPSAPAVTNNINISTNIKCDVVNNVINNGVKYANPVDANSYGSGNSASNKATSHNSNLHNVHFKRKDSRNTVTHVINSIDLNSNTGHTNTNHNVVNNGQHVVAKGSSPPPIKLN